MLTFDQLSTTYADGTRALSGIDISVAAGESTNEPTLALIAAARNSPRMPIGVGDAVMYP